MAERWSYILDYKVKKKNKDYWVYILKCADGSLYTGITVDVDRRVKEHNLGVGAKYTKARRPVRLVYSTLVGNRSVATKREMEIKKLSHDEKKRLAGLVS